MDPKHRTPNSRPTSVRYCLLAAGLSAFALIWSFALRAGTVASFWPVAVTLLAAGGAWIAHFRRNRHGGEQQ